MVEHFTELIVYRTSSELAHQIFVVSQSWPSCERYALTDQLRRASRSVGANLAEAWGKRRYEAHFISKLSDADSENHEVEHWLLTAHSLGYLDSVQLSELLDAKRSVGRMLGQMIQHTRRFLLRRD